MSGEDAGGGTDVLDRELEKLLEEEQLDEGDHDRYSHYVKKNKILSRARYLAPHFCGRSQMD